MIATFALALLLAAQTDPSSSTNNGQTSVPGANSLPAGVRHVGGSVTPPKVLNRIDPEYPKEARKRHVSGVAVVQLIVDAHGIPQNIHILRSIVDTVGDKDRSAALSLDQAAIEAVEKYRFSPAMEGGVPVPVQLNIEISFKIH